MARQKTITLEQVLALAEQLAPVEQVRLVEKLAGQLVEHVRREDRTEFRSLYGLWKDMGVDISEEDIDEARREMWGNFPREDIV